MDNIEKSIKDIIIDKLNVEESEVTNSASLVNDLGADSLDVVDIVMEIENVFGIRISDKAANDIVTVGDAIEAVKGLL